MEMPSFEPVPEEKKVSEPEKKKPGFLQKGKNFIALGAALAALSSEPVSPEAQGADRPQSSRTTERVTHRDNLGIKRTTVKTVGGPLTWANPIDVLTADVGYRPKVVRNTTAFSVGVAGNNARFKIEAQRRHSSQVVNQGSQNRRIKNK